MLDDAIEEASFAMDCGIAGSVPIALESLEETASEEDWSDEPGGVKPVTWFMAPSPPTQGKDRPGEAPTRFGMA